MSSPSLYFAAFLFGGILCLVGQILIDKTKLTPARILVLYVVIAGATVPLTGFGANLASGVRESIKNEGFLGVLTGGITAAAGGITAAVFFGYLAAVFFRPKPKD